MRPRIKPEKILIGSSNEENYISLNCQLHGVFRRSKESKDRKCVKCNRIGTVIPEKNGE